VMDREEVFRASGPGSATRNWVKIGAKKDGTFTAMQARLCYEAGAFKGSPMGPGCMTVFTPYDIENAYVEGFDVVVNKPKVAAYRAPGAPQAEFAAEMVINEIARELGIDPIDIRLKNAAREGTQTLYGPKLKAVGLIECLEACKNSDHYKAALKDNQGRGVAAGFWFNIGGQSSVTINMNPDGTATLVEGSPDIGGSRASMQLMAAEELQIPADKITPIVADTEVLAYNGTTGGSRTTFATGMAVIEAAQDVIRQMKERAAAVWNVTAEQVDWVDGTAVNTAGEGRLTAVEICAGADRTGGQITGRGNINARGAGPSFAVHIADIEVDRDTGRTRVIRYTACQDAGKAIHPSYVEGQYQGGAVQGIGWALNEEYIYSKDGILENPGFLDYRIPLASDLPMIDALIVEVPNAFHPFGVRGVGETGIVPPLAAVGTAVANAAGITVTELPLSPPRVLKAMQSSSR
ncbi:MAG: molybdopterin cofactor-binding domain-containing protein, partial [Pseudomonadales bacterium]